MTDSWQISLLLQILRQPVAEDLRWPSEQQDWRTFAALCDRHQVASLVFCRLRELGDIGLPPGLVQHLRTRFYEISARNYHLAKKLVELISLLEREGIPALAYKGSAVAMIAYGDLALRQHQDLDLLIREEHLLKAVGAMRRAGFEDQPQGGRPYFVPYFCRPENPKHVARAEEIPFRSPDWNYFVDLHWSLGHGWRTFSPDTGMVWNRTEKLELPQGTVSTFCREDLLLALCSHGTKHRWSNLKWLVDVAQLLRNSERLDWCRIEEMTAARPGAGACASLGILLASELLGAPVPPEAERTLPPTKRTCVLAAAVRNEILLNREPGGQYLKTITALEERPLARMRYRATVVMRYPGGLFREVFVQVCEKDRALFPLPEKLHFLYYLLRPLRLVAKHSRRAAMNAFLFR